MFGGFVTAFFKPYMVLFIHSLAGRAPYTQVRLVCHWCPPRHNFSGEPKNGRLLLLLFFYPMHGQTEQACSNNFQHTTVDRRNV